MTNRINVREEVASILATQAAEKEDYLGAADQFRIAARMAWQSPLRKYVYEMNAKAADEKDRLLRCGQTPSLKIGGKFSAS